MFRNERTPDTRFALPMKFLYPLIFLIFIAFSQTLLADSSRIRNVILTGNEAFSSDELQSLMHTQIGEDYSEALLRQDFDQIITFYQEHGFRFARIDESRLFIKKFSEGVYLRIHIDEGKIGKITVSGNQRTWTRVIIRELLFQVGDIYTWEDELESERILRRKRYLGSAEILATREPKTKLVWIEVEVTDLWTFIPALDVPTFSESNSGFLVALSDSNVLGSGDRARLRYQLIREEGEKTRRLVSGGYTESRLFDSHWEFDGVYTQKREGNSWEVRLRRPLYSLQTRWSADFRTSESVDEIRWYEHGTKTDTFERNAHSQSGTLIRSFGDRQQQTQIGLWALSRRSNFQQIEKLAPSEANFEDRDVKMIGVLFGHRHTEFIRARFLNQMGRVEDVHIGYGYSASIGHASPLYGSDRSQTNLSVAFNISQAHQDMLFLNASTDLTTRFTKRQIEDSVFNATIRAIRKNLFHQTLAAQISTVMGFGLDGERQVILGGENGLRGYDTRQFSGEKMIRLNVESRMIFWEHSLLVVGSAIFADMGYIWNGEEFNLGDVKRSVGAGLRFSIPKLNGSRVFRMDLAYPLDGPEKLSFKPILTYAIGHAF
ncbi:MAG: hypothetical protein O7E52_17760 [Candidatus Poribacteria bacterium]|nr:hypothetical protein [Candidatus Poribacteria bacterium]